MSLRIHKVIGYGIANIDVDANKTITDSRIDPKGYLGANPIEREDTYHLQNFFDKLIEGDCEKWMVELYSMDYYSALLSECVHFASHTNKGTLIICPPNKCHCWYRDDDVIDYCEETACSQSQIPHFQILRHGIPSYRSMMDSRDGRPLPTILAKEFVDMLYKYQNCKSDVECLSMESTLRELACDLRFGMIDEAAANVAPIIPDVVSEFCRFLKLFKDEKTILTLRPMLFSYWK